MLNNITLQINLSPGDIHYAHLTIPQLVNSHQANVNEVVAIVDCCRPQKTKIVDPDIRFPLTEFQEKVKKITAIAEELKSKGYIDRIIYLHTDNELQKIIRKKYLANLVKETHDYGGCALMSYFSAFEVSKTKYLLHYDADMLIYQAPNYDWAKEAQYLMEKHPQAVASTPRISPPFSTHTNLEDAPSLHEGRPLTSVEGGWKNDWFSTRCFLMDLEKLTNYLPLIQGKLLLETLAVKYSNRGYPRSPEIMLFKRLGQSGGWRLNLKTQSAWLLHPVSKPPILIELLPQIIDAVSKGIVPESQRGYADVKIAEWQKFLTINSF
jgi:hypothetical protein